SANSDLTEGSRQAEFVPALAFLTGFAAGFGRQRAPVAADCLVSQRFSRCATLVNVPGESVELRLGPRQHLEQEVQLMAHFEAQIFDPSETVDDRSRHDGAHR